MERSLELLEEICLYDVTYAWELKTTGVFLTTQQVMKDQRRRKGYVGLVTNLPCLTGFS